jgi:hypothetical protein
MRPPNPDLSPLPAMESVYRDLFVRELERLGEQDIYMPLGGAANHSLLFLILMIAVRCRPKSVLDVGCGQTTLLWDRLRARGLVQAVTTLESDAGWASRIGAEVRHPILVSPLHPERCGPATIQTYDWSLAEGRGPFDVIVIDGPCGQPRCSRAGALRLIGENLPADFAIVMDDVERRGEQDTLTAIHDRLQAMGRPYETGFVRAANSQYVFAGGAYGPIAMG